MLRCICLLLTTMLMSSIVYADTVTGLLAFYSFTGNADDQSGNGHHGTENNGVALTEDRFGNANSAYSFDGVNDFIDIGSGFISPNVITLSAWVKRDGGSGFDDVLVSSTCGGPIFGFNPSNSLIFGGQCNNPIAHSGSSGFVSDTDTLWHHIAATYSGSAVKVYLDGVVVDSRAASGNYNTSLALSIGSTPALSEGFNGNIDDFRIYNRALNDTDIIELFNDQSTNTAVPEPTSILLLGLSTLFLLRKK